MRDPKSKNDQLIIWFLDLKPHSMHGGSYMLWDNVNPVIENDIYNMPKIKLVDWCYINHFMFETDWNWLMHLVKEIRTRIIIPMDTDLNNFTHDQYQILKGYFLKQLEDVNKEKLYAACSEIIDWWFLVTKQKERQKVKK
jgi:hypothetical protein